MKAFAAALVFGFLGLSAVGCSDASSEQDESDDQVTEDEFKKGAGVYLQITGGTSPESYRVKQATLTYKRTLDSAATCASPVEETSAGKQGFDAEVQEFSFGRAPKNAGAKCKYSISKVSIAADWTGKPATRGIVNLEFSAVGGVDFTQFRIGQARGTDGLSSRGIAVLPPGTASTTLKFSTPFEKLLEEVSGSTPGLFLTLLERN